MRKILPYLCAAFGLFFLGFSALLIYNYQGILSLDSLVHALVVPIQTKNVVDFMYVFTNFGSVGGIIAGLLVVTIIYRHRPDIITRLWVALIGATFSGEYLKIYIHRARPETLPGLPAILNSYSYPSGHSNGSMVFYGFLAILLYVHSSTKIRKILAISIPGILIFLVGMSRIILNYHYASDVIGGYLLGAFWLTFSLAIPIYYELYHQTIQERQTHSEPIERPIV
jgi:undecaprenyl-diphosphatase